MEEWKEKLIGDICSIRRGASPRPIQNYISEHGMPWVKIADATSEPGRFLSQTKEYIIESGVPNSVRVDPGTLIVSNSATPGLPKIMKIEACVHDGWLVLDDYQGVLKDFLYYKFIDIRRSLTNQANGTVFQNLKTDIVKNFPILLPTMPVQKQIVSILSSLDDVIECNRKINANLEQQAQTLFKSWFVDFEPFKDMNFIESDLGMIPEGWKVVSAADVFNINIGKTPPRKEFEWFSDKRLNNIKWVSISDMKDCGAFIDDSSEYLTPGAIEKFNIVVVPRGTVLLSFKLTVGRVAIADDTLTTNEAIARFYLPKEYYRGYIYILLKCYNYSQLGSTSSIATAVNSKIIKQMKLVLPPDSIVKEFDNLTYEIFESIRNNALEITRLSQLRDTLLPKLMSGQIKL